MKIDKKVERVGTRRNNKRVIWKMDLFVLILLSLLIAGGIYYFYGSLTISISLFLGVILIPILFVYFKGVLQRADRIKKIENAFPDFLQLMASNLRAGMTINKAMLLSSREEFAPLDKEILRVGKDITTGKEVETALLDMSDRIESEKIHKTILLIISGLKAGGNLAVLLEETSSNIRERSFVEKRAASSVLMYVIFIFIAVAIIAPALFALSGVLVKSLTDILGKLPPTETSLAVPFTMSKVNVSTTFINYFSLVFILMTDILTSLVLGLVSKGDEKDGIRFLMPIIVLSLVTFFVVKILLSGFLTGLF
jgi:archaeal flagellar protein FlaJ